MIALGLLASATGGVWRESVSSALLSSPLSASLELWLPFWPFEPFLPLFAVGLGTWLLTARPAASAASQERARSSA
jgi:hypothetical protein